MYYQRELVKTQQSPPLNGSFSSAENNHILGASNNTVLKERKPAVTQMKEKVDQ